MRRRRWMNEAEPLTRDVGSVDVVVAAAATMLTVLTSAVSWSAPSQLRSVPAAGWALIFVAGAALVLRRRFPIATAIVTLLASMIYYPLIDEDGAILVTFVIALYTLASLGRLVTAAVIALAAMAASAYGELGTDAHPLGDAGLFLLLGWFVAAVAAGGVVFNRRAYLHEVERNARDLERNQAEALRRRAVEERLRIARELHDVLGHHISMINVQAAAALHRLDRDPAGAGEALAAIKTASGRALRELRSTLGVLRQADEPAPTTPAPALSRIDELVAATAATGLDVRVRTTGSTDRLPTAVDTAAYRIVQEALTNIARHAHAAVVDVDVTVAPGDVTVRVRDDGRGGPGARPASPDGSGERETTGGLSGMRARAAALGGSLSAGPHPGGGFEVVARLPTTAAATSVEPTATGPASTESTTVEPKPTDQGSGS